MDKIIKLAEALGKAIAESPAAKNLTEVRKAMDGEIELKKLLEDFRAQTDKVAQLEQEKKPVEVDDKHKLQDLHNKLVASEVFKQFTAAQVEYVDFMRKINDAMQSQMGEAETEEPKQ